MNEKNEKKPRLINLKHFSFKVTTLEMRKEVWALWRELKTKKDKTDLDKFWLKEFRRKLKETKYAVIVKHKPTGLSKKSTLRSLEIDKKAYADDVLSMVAEKRRQSRVVKKDFKDFYGAKYAMIGGVFHDKDQVNTIGNSSTFNDPLATKVPRQKNNNYIGIELEFNHHPNKRHDHRTIAELFKAAKLGKYVQSGTDGSCGFEVRVLVTEDNYEVVLPKIMKVLTDEGFPCDHRCGTHVHLDMRNRDVRRVYKNFYYTQFFLRKLLTKTRKRNQYCAVNQFDTFDKQVEDGERRKGINVQAYREHKTIEIRMHHGTLDKSELMPWIKLLLKVANYEGTVEKKVLTLKQVSEQFKLDAAHRDQLQSRMGTLFGRVLSTGA